MSPVPTNVSVCVVESPSHYPSPTDPVVLSAVSSMLISPNRVWEDCSSVTLDVYPVYEVSPDTMCWVPANAPVMPPSSKVSLPPPGAPMSLSCSPSRDLSWEGPFDVYFAPLDTGDFPLVSEGLPGCPYRMTSNACTDIAC